MSLQQCLSILASKDIISAKRADEILEIESQKPFSLYWELRLILYLGISFLSVGLGMLLYQNIETIGHQVLIFCVLALCLACFYYASKQLKPFSWQENPNQTQHLADFALLGACLSFLSLEAYLQYQYHWLDNAYHLSALLPTILFFFCAYRFNHRGVLGMAITALASWFGLRIAPVGLWQNNQFNGQNLIITALFLGIFLMLIAWLSMCKNLKKHFSFSYYLFGSNLAFIAALTGLFCYEPAFVYFLAVIFLSVWAIIYARQQSSYLFLLMSILYAYVAVTYGLFQLFKGYESFALVMIYFIFSAAGVVYSLSNIKQLIGHDHTKSI